MSVVANIVLFLHILNDETEDGDLPASVAAINDFLSRRQSNHRFNRVDQHAGGYKVFEASLFALAGNFVTIEDVADAVTSVVWELPHGVQVAFAGQEDERFAFYEYDELLKISARTVSEQNL